MQEQTNIRGNLGSSERQEIGGEYCWGYVGVVAHGIESL